MSNVVPVVMRLKFYDQAHMFMMSPQSSSLTALQQSH